MLLGAVEVAVTAAAKTLDGTTAAAPLLALWGAGSFVGGLLVARLGGGARTGAGAALVLVALTAGSPGADPGGRERPCARDRAAVRRRRDRADRGHPVRDGRRAPPAGDDDRGVRLARHRDGGRRRAGAATAGMLVDRAGPAAAFALAGGAGAIAVLTALLRSRTLLSRQAPAIAGTGTATATATATGTVSIDARALAPAADRPDPRRVTVSLDVITQSSATVTERLPAVGPTLPESIEAVAPVPGRCPLASADSARICCCE